MSEPRGRAATVGLLVGYAVMAFGVVGLFRASSLRSAAQVTTWLVAADLVHDLVVAPLVCLVGFGLASIVPSPWRWPARAGAIGTAVVVAVAYPALRGFGRTTAPGNGSVLPLDYSSATLTVLAVVWGLAALWGTTNLVVERRRATSDGSEGSLARSGRRD
jgi:hypothetical protein